MDKTLSEPLFYILLVYGLSFLTLGVLIRRSTLRLASVPLVASFHVLALFGFVHGMGELIDWVGVIRKAGGAAPAMTSMLASRAFMLGSFVVLLQFGVDVLTVGSARRRLLRALPLALLASFLIVAYAMGARDVDEIARLGRRCLGITAALVAAISFLRLAATLRPLGEARLTGGFFAAGVAFACYAIFGGLLTTPVLGVPIQLFRSACALAIAITVSMALGVYRYVRAA